MLSLQRCRKLALLIFGPMLVETLAMLLMFSMVNMAVDMGHKPREQMLISVSGALTYSISAFIAGRWVTTRIAPWLMIGSIFFAAAGALAGLALESFWGFVAATAWMGTCYGHFYVPFQINLGRVRPFRTLAWSIAFYNIAWGSGAAVGPYLGGLVQGENGRAVWATVASIAGALLMLHVLLHLQAWSSTEEKTDDDPTAAFASTAPQRMGAWVSFFVIGLVFRGFYGSLWLDLARAHAWTDQQAAFGLTAMALPIAVGALLWAKLRHRLIRPNLMLGSMAIGLMGLLGLAWAAHPWIATACGVALGLAESCCVFCALYYANATADPVERSRACGITEMLAGGGFLAGPLLMGLLAWDDATSWRPYAFGVVGIVFSMGWVAWHQRPVATQSR